MSPSKKSRLDNLPVELRKRIYDIAFEDTVELIEESLEHYLYNDLAFNEEIYKYFEYNIPFLRKKLLPIKNSQLNNFETIDDLDDYVRDDIKFNNFIEGKLRLIGELISEIHDILLSIKRERYNDYFFDDIQKSMNFKEHNLIKKIKTLNPKLIKLKNTYNIKIKDEYIRDINKLIKIFNKISKNSIPLFTKYKSSKYTAYRYTRSASKSKQSRYTRKTRSI